MWTFHNAKAQWDGDGMKTLCRKIIEASIESDSVTLVLWTKAFSSEWTGNKIPLDFTLTSIWYLDKVETHTQNYP